MSFIGSCLSGPIFEYVDYENFINLKHNYSNIPFPLKDSLKNLSIGVIYLAITALITPNYDTKYVLTNEFYQQSFFYRIYFYNMMITLTRVRYYAGWLFIQAACSSSGITYNQQTCKFDKIVTIYESLELNHQITIKVEKWNNTVQVWIKRHVYYRIFSEQ